MTLFKALDILIKSIAVSADGRTGDGAGILLIFMIFFKKVCTCPETSEYFLPKRKTS
jgi:hypothetical protein